MPTSFLVPKNNAVGHLNAAITDASLTLTLRSGEGALFPTTYPYHISIDDEILEVSDNTSDVLTFTRAKESTTAAAHLVGAVVSLNITAQALSDLNTAVNTLEGTAHTQGTDTTLGALTAALDINQQDINNANAIYGKSGNADLSLRARKTAAFTGKAFYIYTLNAADAAVERLAITGGVNVAVLTWTNTTQIFDAASLPNADPSVAGQLYYVAATGVVMRSAG